MRQERPRVLAPRLGSLQERRSSCCRAGPSLKIAGSVSRQHPPGRALWQRVSRMAVPVAVGHRVNGRGSRGATVTGAYPSHCPLRGALHAIMPPRPRPFRKPSATGAADVPTKASPSSTAKDKAASAAMPPPPNPPAAQGILEAEVNTLMRVFKVRRCIQHR
jgi:hypothetical protein